MGRSISRARNSGRPAGPALPRSEGDRHGRWGRIDHGARHSSERLHGLGRVLSGLTSPTAVRFSPDGRVFVAEKSGLIKVFDSLADTTPTIFADLRHEVDDYWDRGLLGMTLDPSFPADPYVYVLYAFDAAIGGDRAALERRLPDAARPDHRRLPDQRSPVAADRDRRTSPADRSRS